MSTRPEGQNIETKAKQGVSLESLYETWVVDCKKRVGTDTDGKTGAEWLDARKWNSEKKNYGTKTENEWFKPQAQKKCNGWRAKKTQSGRLSFDKGKVG